MNVVAFSEIMDEGRSVFSTVAKVDDRTMILMLQGEIRVANPYKHLEKFINELRDTIPDLDVDKAVLDFTELTFCNSNGFYVIMNLIETVYETYSGPVEVQRLQEDDWQQEILPILINVDEEDIEARTKFVDLKGP